jgi:hypothetical protein
LKINVVPLGTASALKTMVKAAGWDGLVAVI